MAEKNYTWIGFYEELATRLLTFRDNRAELIRKIRQVYSDIGLKLPKLEKDSNPTDIDPFTVFGLFNKGISEQNRLAIVGGFAREFSVEASVPDRFVGVPVLNNLKATFYWFADGRGEHDIDNLWEVYDAALVLSGDDTTANRERFIAAYDMVSTQKGIKWNITMGLYWVRPYYFINLDSKNRWYMQEPNVMPEDFVRDVAPLLKSVPSAEEYLQIRDQCSEVIDSGRSAFHNFPELSYHAWKVADEVNQELAKDDWRPTDYESGISESDWETLLADPQIFSAGSLEIMKRMKDYGGEATCNQLSAKYGESSSFYSTGSGSLARRIAEKTGCPIYLKGDEASRYWPILYLGRDAGKSGKGSFVWKLRDELSAALDKADLGNVPLYKEEEAEEDEEQEEKAACYPPYTEEDFLKEVYIGAKEYRTLVGLLRNKKNIILQGAPGVGKTFIAKRLAYSIMGVRDMDRVMMVQFHQSYSYEDFIMGFRPSKDGFELKKGAFYNFCKRAEVDSENDYFFIIDEINRGNLSKIFGELFMLIENDKRGSRSKLRLLYSDELFYVPENVYIIGMMNTADRSLAMLDYALRRRFAFFDLKPGFASDGFRAYRTALNNAKFDRLIQTVEQLNENIANDETLGEGFCIGHSYFCNQTADEIDDEKLSGIVEYELIPLLKEYWFDEPGKVRDWSEALRSAVR